jgi:sugar/nucleoside kinase (ribokinase family)
MTSESEVDLLLVDYLARDRNVVDGVRQVDAGGDGYLGAVALRRLGASVAVVTRLHPDDFSMLEALRQEGGRVYATPAPETSGIANHCRSDDMERRTCQPLSFAGPFRPDEIPDLAARIYAVTSLKQELPGPWRGSLADVETRLAAPPETAL